MIKAYLHTAIRRPFAAQRWILLAALRSGRNQQIPVRRCPIEDGQQLDTAHPERPPYTIFEQ
jgi:hypothetical protein